MASNVKITFILDPLFNETLNVSVVTGSGTGITFPMKFVDVRSQKGESTTPGTGLGGDAELQAAFNYTLAWNADYRYFGSSDKLEATISGAEVTITLKDPTWKFRDATPAVTGTAVTNNRVSFITTNEAQQTIKTASITNYFADVGNPCGNTIAQITAVGGNGFYNAYVSNVLVASNQASPFNITLARGAALAVKITDTTGALISDIIARPPRKLIQDDIAIKITNLQTGATVSADVNFISSYIEPYEYSINGSVYQSSNVFTGIVDGNYTLYVKDAFGCVTTKTFVVDGVTELTQPVFSISDINALRFSKYETGKKNHKNTLSCNEIKRYVNKFIHYYDENDIIPVQFKAKAPFIDVYGLDSDGVKTALFPIQKTENTGLEAKSTATYFNYGDGRSAIYFGVVNLLDPITDVVIGTQDFGFSLPEWADTVGDYVTIDGVGQVPIDDIGYSDFYDSFVLIFNIAYTGSPVTRNLYALYNIQPYEVYEFSIDMTLMPDNFNVVIQAGINVNDIHFTYISEMIRKIKDSDKYLEIKYWDVENKGEMVYQTGIKHLIRIAGQVDYLGDQETEGYNGDTDYFVTDNTIYDSQRFVFYRLSSEMAHKLRLVMAHNNLFINGLSYKIAEAPEITTNINNNLKTFSVTLKRGGDQFLTNEQEIITGTSEAEALSAAIEASRGKSLLLWTKTNG